MVPRDKDANGEPIDGTGGFKKATCDQQIIRGWWGKWPNAMIGAATGEPSDFWAIDLDVSKLVKGINGKPDWWTPDGFASWSALLAEHGPYDDTIEVKTRRWPYLFSI